MFWVALIISLVAALTLGPLWGLFTFVIGVSVAYALAWIMALALLD